MWRSAKGGSRCASIRMRCRARPLARVLVLSAGVRQLNQALMGTSRANQRRSIRHVRSARRYLRSGPMPFPRFPAAIFSRLVGCKLNLFDANNRAQPLQSLLQKPEDHLFYTGGTFNISLPSE
jgi:hypothetical protein